MTIKNNWVDGERVNAAAMNAIADAVNAGGDPATVTHGTAAKVTPSDFDEMPLVDSAAANVLKKTTFGYIKAWIKSWIVRGDVGLGNVDNTADAVKPVSAAQQSAIDLKAPLASPTFTGTVSGVTKTAVGLGSVDNTSDSNKPVSSAQQAALDAKQPVLTATSVKTAAYTAAVSDLIPVDATTGPVPITLPTAPVDKARVVVKKIDATTNAVTVVCGGSDVFNKSGGSTSLTLLLANQAIQLQYKATGGVWYVVSTDVPLGGLDGRYAPVTYVSGAYPPRPAVVAGAARYLGPSTAAPTTALAGDQWIPTKTTRNVILSTDIYTDVEDISAIRMLAYHHAIGDVNLIAAVIDTASQQVVTQALDAVLQNHNIVVPIGKVSTTYSDLTATGSFQASMAANFPHRDWATTPDAAAVMRQALVNSTSKVDIICIGYQSAMHALQSSAADGISSMTGIQLINAKVNKVWIMGGQYPSGPENNFNRGAKEIAAAAAVVNNWPTNFPTIPISFSGYETGISVLSGGNLVTDAPVKDLLRQAYGDFGASAGRASWDTMLVRLACLNDPTIAGYTTVAGLNSVNASTGSTTFTPGAGNQVYTVKNKSDAAFVAELNSFKVIGAQPAGAITGPQIYTGTAWVPSSVRDNAPVLSPVPQKADPPDLTLIDAWSANSLSGTADGTTIASWPSANPVGGVALAQATSGKQPTFKASVGGRPAVSFGGAHWMETGSNIVIPTDGRYTVYALAYFDTLPSSTTQCLAAMDSGSPNRDWHLKVASGGVVTAANFLYDFSGVGATDTAPNAMTSGRWQLVVMRQDPAKGLEALMADGSTMAASDGTASVRAVLTAAMPLHVGVTQTTSTPLEPLTGYLNAVLVYAGRHSDLQISAIAARLGVELGAQYGSVGVVSNKTIDNTNTIIGREDKTVIQQVADPTKQGRFAISASATTAQTIVQTLPITTGNLANDSNFLTMTNKRITKRVITATSSATPTPTGDTADVWYLSTLTVAATFAAPTGTPTDGQELTIRVKSAAAQTLAFNSIYLASGVYALPTTSVAGKTITMRFQYDTAQVKWVLMFSDPTGY